MQKMARGGKTCKDIIDGCIVLFIISLSEVDSHMYYLDYYIIDNNILFKSAEASGPNS